MKMKKLVASVLALSVMAGVAVARPVFIKGQVRMGVVVPGAPRPVSAEPKAVPFRRFPGRYTGADCFKYGHANLLSMYIPLFA